MKDALEELAQFVALVAVCVLVVTGVIAICGVLGGFVFADWNAVWTGLRAGVVAVVAGVILGTIAFIYRREADDEQGT